MRAPDPSSTGEAGCERAAELFAAALDGGSLAAAGDLPTARQAELEAMLRAHALLHAAGAGGVSTASNARARERIGPYELIELVGRGGQGEVWLALDTRLQRRVALKVIAAPGAGDDSQRLLRLRREAEIAARLEHPGICPVYDVGRDGARSWVAMRYVPGRTLAQELAAEAARQRRGGRSLGERLAIVEHVARTLHAAHQAGIVHRDVKPGNIVLDASDAPVLLDFGLAQDAGAAAGVAASTVAGATAGTPEYLAPERISPELGATDARSDVWSLAATCFELVTGERPFAALTREGLYRAILTLDPGHHLRRRPRLPRDLCRVLEVALAKRQDARYRTALAFAEDLARVRRGEPLRGRGTARLTRTWRLLQRHRLAAAIVLVVLGALTFAWLSTVASLAGTRAALARADGLRLLAEAQNTATRDPGGALRAALAGAATAPAPLANDAILRILEHVRELRLLPRHPAPVRDVAWSPDARLLATVCDDGHVRVFAAARGALLAQHDLGTAAATSSDGSTDAAAEHVRSALAFSTSGERLGVAAAGVVLVLAVNVAPGAPTLAVRARFAASSAVRTLAFAGDDALVTGAADGTLALWRLPGATAKHVTRRTLGRHRAAVNAVAVDADGTAIASAAEDGTLRVTRAYDGSVLREEHHGPRGVRDVAFSADGCRVAAACADGAARVFEVASGELVHELRGHESAVLSVAFARRATPGGRQGDLLATASWDRSVRVWDATTGDLLSTCTGHRRPVLSVCFAPSGDTVASAAEDGTVRLWRPGPPPGVATLPHGPWGTTAACFDPAGRLVATASTAPNPDTWSPYVKLWRARDGSLLASLPVPAAVTSLAFTCDGARLVVASRDGCLRTFDTAAGTETCCWRLPLGPDERPFVHVQPDPSARCLLAACTTGKGWLLDARSGRVLHEVRALPPFHWTGPVARSAFDARGTLLATTGEGDDGGQHVLLWDVATGAQLGTLVGHQGIVQSVAFSPAGDRLATAACDGTARVWRLADGACVVLRGHRQDNVLQAAWSPDGTRIVTCGGDGTARVWNATTGAALVVLEGHESLVYTASFDGSGERVVTASWDGTAAVWDARTGERLVRQEAHGRPVFAASFSPDGESVLSAGLDGTARVWPADPLRYARTTFAAFTPEPESLAPRP